MVSEKVSASYQLRKEGKSVKFVKVLTVVAMAIGALSLGACANKPHSAPPPASIGTSK